MRSREYDVRLSNANLCDAGRKLRIVDVAESQPDEKEQSVAGVADGTRLLRKTRRSLSVSVAFELREEDKRRRIEAYNRVLDWARGGGYLTINSRPGQRLYVEGVKPPGLGSVKRWTDALTLVFTAYARPYWESEFPAEVRCGGAQLGSGSATIVPPGNADECLTDAEITAAGVTTVNTLTLTAGGTSMTFAGLGLGVGQTLRIAHTDAGLLVMKIGNVSAMSKRTAASADELLLRPGRSNAVSFTAGAACAAVFRTRGRWR